MRSLGRFLVRLTSFLHKEVAEILRQPRLILTLVLGPFLILLLFGIGYFNEARALRTMFVVDPGSPLASQIEEYATSLGPQLVYMGSTGDEAQARRQLAQRAVDVVVVTPPDAYDALRNNRQATFTLLYNEIDPTQVEYVKYFGKIYVDEVNRRLLQTFTAQGQSKSQTLQQDLTDARSATRTMRDALQRGDVATAKQSQQSLSSKLGAVELAVGASLGMMGGVQNTLGPGGDGQGSDRISSSLNDARQGANELSDLPAGQGSYAPQVERLNRIDQDLGSLQQDLQEFQAISPNVLVSPFQSDAKSIAPVQPSVADYFAPAVIVLLLQHLAVTFGALSIVRERQLGTMELFVAPLSAGETLFSKYLSYMLFGGVLAAILTALMVWGLGVPMLGDWRYFTLAVAALLFTSLGFGFAISLISRTDSQAVQFAMIVLLTSVFFSGFILSLNSLLPAVQVVSWMAPATYAISLLQNIMLRGTFLQPLLLSALAAIGVGLFVLDWLLLRRSMQRA